MKKLFFVIPVLLILGIIFYACQDTNIVESTNSNPTLKLVIPDVTLCGSSFSYDLLAGNDQVPYGTVEIGNDENYIYVKYTITEDGCYLNEVHVDISTEIPTEKGEPGHYTYNSSTLDAGTIEFTAIIPITWACGQQLYLKTHASTCGETAYAGTFIDVDNGPWFNYIGYVVQCCEPPEKCYDYQCETAFGGDNVGPTTKGNKAWWFYYNTTTGGVQTIWAGKTIEAGTVKYENGKIVIILAEGWSLKEYEWTEEGCGYPDITKPYTEAVKIQGYDILPTAKPTPGLFTTYKGMDLTVPVDSYPYYVIHLDLVKTTEVPCPEE